MKLCIVFISLPTLAENIVTPHPMTFFWMSLIILIITTDNINKDGLVSWSLNYLTQGG